MPEKISTRGNAFSVSIGVLTLKLLGWRLQGEFPNEKKVILVVAPHTSNWDFVLGLAFMFALRLNASFMAKSDLFVGPLKLIMKGLGGIAIKRHRAHGVVAQMADRFEQSDALVLALAPEGTRRLVPRWKTGFLQIAARANVPILLIGLDYKRKCLLVGPCKRISNDANIEDELQQVLEFYSAISGKYPENCDTTGLNLEKKVGK
ncbi:1-acyl-sn-glycerol-3-phosphate acyltransferase [Alteromonas sp. a30]|uniref:1-acyl-sn-glycerol-3-phosphate acyltransferase n=1 Tax=Alteromonas sp. a30 TaxID=2730917 RepID=UPI00227EC91D|nr:1-acyl-sn-glycerol-3-phosphate acyltransferase [Alteromonas sp. a30]MCY7293957.1 acyltransferase [Alteromonas sp. a30]